MKKKIAYWLIQGSTLSTFFLARNLNAQIIHDNTLPINSVVTPQNDGIQQITGGTRAGNNLFHSFEQFSISVDEIAFFKNALDVKNILSRVTGNFPSDIQGIISTLGTTNLFLINPNGIIFGENASLNVGGSFIATTADSILFPNGIEYSATSTQTKPLLTINTPIGLNFRDNPQPIRNLSFVTDETGDDLIGLRVAENQTIGLIGGDILLEGGFVSTLGGRIELGSVGDDSIVTLTEVDKGWDFSYEGVENFRDINLSFAAFVETIGTNTGGIELQGRNISLTEGSQLAINTDRGKAGNLTVIATESLSLDGNGIEADPNFGDFPTAIFSDISNEATGKGSQIRVEAPQLTIANGSQIYANNFNGGKGVDIIIDASDIVIETAFIDEELDIFQGVGIFTEVESEAIGDGGNITVNTETLNLNNGAQIFTSTLGAGNAGNLIVNASKSIELIGTIPNSTDPSALFANVGKADTAIGDGGNITVNTPRLVLKDGAQIASNARNQGNGGKLEINVLESILLSGTSPLVEFQEGGRSGIGRSAIISDAQPSFRDEEGNPVVTTGNGGTLDLTTGKLIIEKGAIISTDNFGRGKGGIATINVDNLIVRSGGQIDAGSLLGVSPIDNQRGAGGTLNIEASDSIIVTGKSIINGTLVTSSLFTLAEGTGDAGDLFINTPNLTVSNGGEITAQSSGTGKGGSITATTKEITLNNGFINASTASTQGGNITLNIDNNLQFVNNGEITATAGTAQAGGDGGNVEIDSDFILAFPTDNTYQITAEAFEGKGGNIIIATNSIFGEEFLNISASSQFGLDGEIAIETPEVDPVQGLINLPIDVIDPSQFVSQSCLAGDRETAGKSSEFIVTGRGGLPPSPNESLKGDATIAPEWVAINSLETEKTEAVKGKTNQESPAAKLPQIVQARGWVRGENGRLTLVAENPYGVAAESSVGYVGCKSF